MKFFLGAVLLFFASAACFAQEVRIPEKPFDVGVRAGEKIPAFRLTGQTGKEFDFNSLKGPKGLALLFVRSADW